MGHPRLLLLDTILPLSLNTAELPLSGPGSFAFPLMLTPPPITPGDVGATHPPGKVALWPRL